MPKSEVNKLVAGEIIGSAAEVVLGVAALLAAVRALEAVFAIFA